MTVRPVPTSYSSPPRHTIVAIGDSLTWSYYFPGLRADLNFPEVLAAMLRDGGASVKARNTGIGGQTTTQMAASPRVNAPLYYEVPDIIVIYGGTNDPGNGVLAATTQANLTAMVQAYINAGVSKVVVVGQHYKNYSAGGDTTTVQNSGELALRNAQQGAVSSFTGASAGKVVYADLYAFTKVLIGGTYKTRDGVTYTFPQGADCTPSLGMFGQHVADANAHLDYLGQDILAAGVLAAIKAQGWDKALV